MEKIIYASGRIRFEAIKIALLIKELESHEWVKS
jgi:hypothetical protein